ncbi:MAG: TraR/DksA family transcriptional regulator [Nitrospirae bacterium]|nr:TraR/DksA family transcriptional regulator [Nitrospirota bacterium]
MNKTELEQFKLRLFSLRTELQGFEEAPIKAAKLVEPDQDNMGRLSLMGAMIAQRRSEESSRLRQRQLQKIDGALRRIEFGEYGKCFMCEEEIEAQRLSVDPTDTRCMKCIEE